MRPVSVAFVDALAVALSIASGVIIGGIVGALLAVPFAACVNAAGGYLAARDRPGGLGKGDAAPTAIEPT